MLQPIVRRTWAPRGITPVHRSWARHDRLSVISALTLSPKRRRIGLYFSIHRDNIHANATLQFIRRIRRQLGGRKLLLVWDRLNVHRSAATQLTKTDAIKIEWLPAYAPDLNPVESIWRQTKYADLANLLPVDLNHLEAEVIVSLLFQRDDQERLAAYFRHSGLPI
jgi:transposase